jgi:hypothetical protein
MDLKRSFMSEEEVAQDEEENFLQMVCSPLAPLNVNLSQQRRTQQGRGSRKGKLGNLNRERHRGHVKMWEDYFSSTPTYGPDIFRRRFRMRRELFWKIHDKICGEDEYFIQKRDATGLLGLSSIQKITAALRMLALGVGGDATDEYCRLSKSTALNSLLRFVKAVRVVFEAEYLSQPTREEVEMQLQVNAARGFPGMFGSIDCMHVKWKNCPVAWQGFFLNKDGDKSLVLEAVCDQYL